MSIIHKTTLAPAKLELLASWLPAQPWYRGPVGTAQLARAGGFRLDDPHGQVGIEFMVVTDGTRPDAVSYLLPLTYRAAALETADHALIGTAVHGVLGQRWVYDGTHDPVLAAQLLALIEGTAEPQAQSVSDTPDRSVSTHFAGPGPAAMRSMTTVSGPHGTDIVLETRSSAGAERATDRVSIAISRVLSPSTEDSGAAATALGWVRAGWSMPDGARVRGLFAVLRAAAPA